MRNTRQSRESLSRSRRNATRSGRADTTRLDKKSRTESSTTRELKNTEAKPRNLRSSPKVDSKKVPKLHGKRGVVKQVSSDEDDTDDEIPKKKNKKEDRTPSRSTRSKVSEEIRSTRSTRSSPREAKRNIKAQRRSSSKEKTHKEISDEEEESDAESHQTESTNGTVPSLDSEVEFNLGKGKSLSHVLEKVKSTKEQNKTHKISTRSAPDSSHDEDDDIHNCDQESEIHDILDDSDEDDLIYTGEEVGDEDDDDDVISVGSEADGDIDISDDSDDEDSDIIETGISGRINVRQAQSRAWDHNKEAEKMELAMVALELKLNAMKEDYEKKLEKKNDDMKRLENELKWKEEQLDELEYLSNRNMELESRINLMLTGKEEYEMEVKRVKEKEEEETKEKERAKEEAEEKEEKLKNKSETDEDDENDENDEIDEGGKPKKKSRRRSQRKKEEDDGKDEIDAYFVDDDSDIELIKEEKPKKHDEDTKKADEKAKEADEKIKKDDDDKHENKNKSEDKPKKKEESTESDADKDDPDLASPAGRHNIRKLMGSKKLQEETKQAAKAEKERIERAKKEHDKHLRVEEINRKKEPITKQLVLALKAGGKNPLVEVNQKLIKKLKPHQVDAVEFIWDNVIESMEKLKQKSEGSGCLLAHCMGLGKTLSVITVVHTLLTSKCVNFKRCLVVCPLNTVFNWQYEWNKWLDKKDRLKVFELVSAKKNHERTERLQKWKKTGGIMIMGYHLFRILGNYSGRSKKTKKILEESLLDPGPDIIVCDEGHILKNDASAISKCMNRIKTKRRIILTGTPLQNNLVEYHCMVNFVKPNLLGSRREFSNRFVNPITNGQHSDSTSFDVKIMKRRAHILHAMLDGCVQRRDYTALTKFLPPKYEYVISVRLSKLQIQLYEKYLEIHRPEASMANSSSGAGGSFKVRGAGLFSDYQNLMRIWTHPWQLKLEEARQEKKPYKEDDDDELESVLFTSSSEDEGEDGATTTTTTSSLSADEEVIISSDEEEENEKEKEEEEEEEAVVTTPRRSSRRITNDDNGSDSRKSRNDDKNSDKNDKTVEESIKQHSRRSHQETKDTEKDSKKTNKTEKRKQTDTEDSESDSKKKDGSSKAKKNKPSEANGSSKDGETTTNENGDGTRKAKLIAGEVIRQWQSQSRGTGKDEEFKRKVEDPWWFKFITEDAKTQLELGGKLVIMFEILRMAETMGDKLLLFSQSLLTLDIIEDFLSYKDHEAQEHSKGKNKPCRWEKDEDYCRMDGSTLAINRRKLTNHFNDVKNKRMRLFLISTKAGGLGINLDRANRVIIFDASWNPSHDIQSIFRVYRFGQEKDVFVYRLLAQGTMEEKIYERQVTKETMSQRVIDEHQIDRHFTANDLQELYLFKPDKLDDPNREKKPTPAVPKDIILAELLSSQMDWIVQYHEHDSLLENRPDEDLSEEERQHAWEEYERDKKGMGTLYRTIQPNYGMHMADMNMYSRFGSMVSSGPKVIPNFSIPGNLTNVQTSAGESGKTPFLTTLPGYNATTSLNTQISQLPKVVQEIIKYNPSIPSDELSKRLQAFLGMHNRYGQVPGHAVAGATNKPIHLKITSQGPQGLQTMKVALPGLSLSHLLPSRSNVSTAVSSSQGVTTVMPDITSLSSTQQMANVLSNHGSTPATSLLMPSRLPMPGSVPAMRK